MTVQNSDAEQKRVQGGRMRIFLVEDDDDVAGLVQEGLTKLHHLVERSASVDDAVRCVSANDFDVLIIDRMLPDGDGLEVLKRARRGAVGTPVLVLTARGSIEDRVVGLESGADDYLIKPFAFAELAARVAALGRRPRAADDHGIVSAGRLRLDRINRKVTREGRPITLQPREFQLLDELARHIGRVVTRAMLLRAVWSFNFDTQTNIVESHMSRLRTKLDFGFVDSAIETVRGEGYRLRGDV